MLLLADNSFFWIVSYLGVLRAGLVAVPLPVGIETADLRHVIGTTEPKFCFLQSKAVKVVTSCSTLTPRVGLITDTKTSGTADFHDIMAGGSHPTRGDNKLPQTGWNDLAALMFTSGTTGKPRGVMISHGNIISNTESIVASLSLTAGDRIMAVLPFYYCFGASILHTHLLVGGSLVADTRFMYPDKILERLNETRCTGFAGVPSHFQILLRKSSLSTMTFPHLRHVQQAGGHLASVFVQQLIAALPTSEVFLMYGQTEATARLSCLAPAMTASKPASIGKAIPGVKLRVVNELGRDVEPGQDGEIVAEGKNIAVGYWRDAEGSASTFREGKLFTGDIATVDDEGFIFVQDRARDFIKCGGERISCQALEEQLIEFDELLEAAVIGVPDDLLGEAIKAYIVPRDGNLVGLEERVRKFCKQSISFKRIPKFIVPLKALPKSHAGKVLKAALREL